MTSSTDTVLVGSRVMLRDPDGEDAFNIVRPEDADFTQGHISMDSPLGRALLGRSAGERLRVRTPGGLRPVVILSVD